MRSVELFAGAGGLAIGMAKAGFHHAAVIERDPDACETFRENQRKHQKAVEQWPLHEGDVKMFDYGTLRDIAVVSGGPPCQPFSLGGKHKAYNDKRDMFPEAVRAIRELRPKAFILENVKGLMRQTFTDYFEHVLLQLSYPSLTRSKVESWKQHRSRLEQHQTSQPEAAEYNIVFRLLNAADYGVPQRRERVFFVGFRSDLGVKWAFPEGKVFRKRPFEIAVAHRRILGRPQSGEASSPRSMRANESPDRTPSFGRGYPLRDGQAALADGPRRSQRPSRPGRRTLERLFEPCFQPRRPEL